MCVSQLSKRIVFYFFSLIPCGEKPSVFCFLQSHEWIFVWRELTYYLLAVVDDTSEKPPHGSGKTFLEIFEIALVTLVVSFCSVELCYLGFLPNWRCNGTSASVSHSLLVVTLNSVISFPHCAVVHSARFHGRE